MDVQRITGSYEDLTGFSFSEICKDIAPGKWEIDESKMVDRKTGKRYFNENLWIIRQKCFALAFASFSIAIICFFLIENKYVKIATALLFLNVQSFFLMLNSAYRIFKCVSFVHLWSCHYKDISKKERWKAWGVDLLRIVMAPMAFIAMLFSSFYGIIDPRNGRKWYGHTEKMIYGESFLALCFNGKDPEKYFVNSSDYWGVPMQWIGLPFFTKKTREDNAAYLPMVFQRGLFSHKIEKSTIFKMLYKIKKEPDNTNLPARCMKRYKITFRAFKKIWEKYGGLQTEELNIKRWVFKAYNQGYNLAALKKEFQEKFQDHENLEELKEKLEREFLSEENRDENKVKEEVLFERISFPFFPS